MQMTLLTRGQTPKRPALSLLKDIGLDLGRVHECAGRARRVFALMLAARTSGPVLWIAPAYGTDRLNPDGMLSFVDRGGLSLWPHNVPRIFYGQWKRRCVGGGNPLVMQPDMAKELPHDHLRWHLARSRARRPRD